MPIIYSLAGLPNELGEISCGQVTEAYLRIQFDLVLAAEFSIGPRLPGII